MQSQNSNDSTNLSSWLEAYIHVLIEAAVLRLSQDEILKLEVVESVEVFFDGFLQSARIGEIDPLNTVLMRWIETQSTPTEADFTSLVPVLATLKEVTWTKIVELCPSDQAIYLLTDSDAIFTQALMYLSRLETDSLLKNMRNQLHKAQAHVKRLDKSKSNFIAVAAHELRTPLTLVEGYTDMMASSPFMAQDPQLPLLLEGISSGTKRLREIINDLIDVSLLDLKLMELHLQPVWLLQVLNAAERSVGKLLVNRRLELIIERNTIPVTPTAADPDRILQVIQKVLMNAVKYTPDDSKIIIRGRELPGFTDIMVIDNGIGIAPWWSAGGNKQHNNQEK